MLRVTLDTDVLPADDVLTAAAGRDIAFAAVSVTVRETRGTSFEIKLSDLTTVPETGVFDESEWDGAVFAEDKGPGPDLEELLRIISSGSFPPPGKRDSLTEGQRHQLRDAMILQAHAREGRDIFVSGDTRAFFKHGRREQLSAVARSQIMSRVEFTAWLLAPGAP